ncbi:MAG: hypothetical protein J7M14_08060 [Planctomycetes bacterium]|nr:hypothetical protein [Planctomycetota bacterium]
MRPVQISAVLSLPFRYPILIFLSLLFSAILYTVNLQASLYDIQNPRWVLTMGVLILLSPLFNGLFILLARGLASNERPSLRDAFSHTFSSYGALVSGEIIVNLGVALGMILFFLPGIYLGLRWSFYKQAILIDGTKGVDGMRLSYARTRDSRTFVTLLLFLSAFYLPTILLSYAVVSLPLGTWGDVLATFSSSLTYAWANTLLAVLYLSQAQITPEKSEHSL